ncbi:MAG: BRO family protein [Catonella sp.]
MQNDLMVFQNQEFGEVRSVMINGEPWFIGKDIASVLGYKDTSDAIKRHVENEDKGVGDLPTPGGTQKMQLINESGLYSLILSSKLPNARKFKKWVTSEVLPSIRKHGAYLTPDKVEEVLLNPDTIIKIAQNLKEEQEKRKQLEIENNELKPKANYCEQVLQSTNAVVTTQIAKDYGMSPQALNNILHDLGVQYKIDGQWLLYSKYQDKGYTKSCTIIDRTGETRLQTKWTQKGRLFIYEILKTIGILPNMEREIKRVTKKTKAGKKVSTLDPLFAKLYSVYENKGINKGEFARCCSVTSPTLNKMIDKYKKEIFS